GPPCREKATAFARFLLGLDFHPTARIKFIEQPGELADGRLIRQPVNLVAFERISDSLVESMPVGLRSADEVLRNHTSKSKDKWVSAKIGIRKTADAEHTCIALHHGERKPARRVPLYEAIRISMRNDRNGS